MIQLDLFHEVDEISILRAELKDVKKKSENVRRGLFARHNELAKMYLEVKQKLEKIEEKICHNKKSDFRDGLFSKLNQS